MFFDFGLCLVLVAYECLFDWFVWVGCCLFCLLVFVDYYFLDVV